jgi:hypothetical protein
MYPANSVAVKRGVFVSPCNEHWAFLTMIRMMPVDHSSWFLSVLLKWYMPHPSFKETGGRVFRNARTVLLPFEEPLPCLAAGNTRAMD